MTTIKSSTEFAEAIEALRQEAAQAGDEAQVAICERFAVGSTWLYDSECPEEKIGVPECGLVGYLDALAESLDDGGETGHVRYEGNTVFAQESPFEL